MKRAMVFLFLVSLLMLAACARTGGGEAQIEVQQAWARPAAAGSNSAAYMVLVNRGGAADRLLRAECQAARAVELHESMMHGDMMQMQPVAAIDVPAGGRAELKPGGLHIMLIDLQQELTAGQTLTLTLIFEKAGAVTVQAAVEMR